MTDQELYDLRRIVSYAERLSQEIRCANCAFWGLCYHFADAERTIIEGKAKQECTVNLYNWLRQEVGAPGTMVSFPWGKTLEGAMSP